MKNVVVGEYEAADIRAMVAKILRDLDSPEPPLDLDQVRLLLKLDRQYYSTSDDSAAREFISKLKKAGKQLIAQPMRLIDVIRRAKLSALWVPDRRRILIDQESPEKKHRWYEAHEVGHSITPWHQEFLFGDDRETLDEACHDQLEAEANFAAGQLLFLQGHFVDEANALAPTLDSVKALANRYGNTITSTLWRLVEEAHQPTPMLGFVTNADTGECRYFVRSPSFRERFGNVTEQRVQGGIDSYCSHRRGGPLGAAHVLLDDSRGEWHRFAFESFSNRYDVLTLATYVGPIARIVPIAAF